MRSGEMRRKRMIMKELQVPGVLKKCLTSVGKRAFGNWMDGHVYEGVRGPLGHSRQEPGVAHLIGNGHHQGRERREMD